MTFNEFTFSEKLLEGLSAMGFQKATPIQELAIPAILNNKDLIACAQTGTGKTGAYILPVLNKIINKENTGINTLIIAPTRELAQQIDQQIEGFGYFLSVSSIPVYGGGDGSTWDQQKKAMLEGADIIIATPGRLIAQITSGQIDLSKVEHLILDEADRMLDMGFYEDIIRIISYLPKNRQTILFSATMPNKIRQLAAKILNNPEEINIAISQPAEGINQQAYLVYDQQKVSLVKTLLKSGSYSSVIVFCSTKDTVKSLARELKSSGMHIKPFHSDLEQIEREEILRDFKSRKVQVLVGTDVLSRGIDVEGIDLVINVDVPPDPEDYIHRIGRTARAASTGTAVTLINEKDQNRFRRIESLIGKEINKLPLPEGFGEGPVYNPLANKGPNNNKRKKKPRFKKPNGPGKDQSTNSNK